jgi:hypothetical protein
MAVSKASLELSTVPLMSFIVRYLVMPPMLLTTPEIGNRISDKESFRVVSNLLSAGTEVIKVRPSLIFD